MKFVQMLYTACDELAADPQLTFDTAKQWYTDWGREISDEELQAEVDAKPVFTSDYAKQIDLTEFAVSYSEYFADQGLIEKDRVETVKENCANDLLEDALASFN